MKAVNWKFGMSSCSTTSIGYDTFRQYAENGVELMEISLDWKEYPHIQWENVKQYSKETGVGLWSFHLPFFPFETNNIASLNPEVRKNTIALQKEYIKRASELGIGIAVIHPSGEPNGDAERPEHIKAAMDSLNLLAETASSCGMTLAVEDLPRTCIGNTTAEIKQLISAHEKLRVCFDTNHLLQDRDVDFARELGDKIVTLHVSDYDYRNERHWLPYEGKVDWVELITVLEQVGYSGALMYEIGLKTPDTIVRGRNLTFKDFADNYKALVEKRPLSPLGTPDPVKSMEWVFYREPVIQ